MGDAGITSLPRVSPPSVQSAGNGVDREHVSEIQRARILAAMVKVCAEGGAASATVAKVVECAGVSRRTFYELFDDCQDCFEATLEHVIESASRRVAVAYDSSARWVERIRAVLIELLLLLEEDPRIGALLLADSHGGGAASRAHRRRVVAQMTSLIDEGRSESKRGAELPPLTAEGVVGGALSILQARLIDGPPRQHRGLAEEPSHSLVELTGPLMSMIVLPYLGPVAARRELLRPVPEAAIHVSVSGEDPLRGLGMRLTYRTMRVLKAVAARPGASNRQVANDSGIADQGQISKLLARLQRLRLIENADAGATRGGPNAWMLTAEGIEVERALSVEGIPEGAR